MRYLVAFLFILFSINQASAQITSIELKSQSPAEVKQKTINLLLVELNQTTEFPIRLQILDSLSMYYLYFSVNTDSSLFYGMMNVATKFGEGTELIIELPIK